MKRLTAALLTLGLVGGCTTAEPRPAITPGEPVTLRVLAGSELQDMAPILDDAAKATGVSVDLDYVGSVEGAQRVADGKADGVYDAVWFSSTRYLRTIPAARTRLGPSTRTMASPVVLGLRQPVARTLGWDRTPPTWATIAAAAKAGKFTFAMTDPAASNTGFSALIAVATALAGTGAALDKPAIERLAGPLAGFYAAQHLTAGSSAWLTDAFVARATGADPGPRLDGLVNYESSLAALNRSKTLPEPLTLIYPSDGVISADYPLTVLNGASAAARDAYRRLSGYLETTDVQRRIVARTLRRPVKPGVPLAAGQPADLVEIPFPGTRAAIEALLDAYYDRFRRASRTIYVLDVSGSMAKPAGAGTRLAALQRALTGLAGADTSLSGRYCRFRSREDVTLLLFNDRVGAPRRFTIEETNPAASRTAIRSAVGRFRASGDTAMYDALVRAYGLLDAAADTDRFTSVVLMTDGERTTGRTSADFEKFVAGRTGDRAVPVFPILFGDARTAEMKRIAAVTHGRYVDGRTSDLGHAFCTIRGYQ